MTYHTGRHILTSLLAAGVVAVLAAPAAFAEPRGPGNPSEPTLRIYDADARAYAAELASTLESWRRVDEQRAALSPHGRGFDRGTPRATRSDQLVRSTSPDDRPFFRGVESPPASGRIIFSVPDEFHWSDAGVGAAVTLGFLLLIGSTAVLVRQKRRRIAVS